MTESRSVVLGAGGEKRRLATKGHEGNLGVHRNVYIMITWPIPMSELIKLYT